METMWHHFWKFGNRYLLAVALIINEQNYLEKRVVRNSYYQKTVFQTIEFKLQDVLSLYQIIFPCYQPLNNTSEHKTGIIGQPLHHFASLHDRILLGKRLYSIIFKDQNVLKRLTDWAADHPHTGSRKDYGDWFKEWKLIPYFVDQKEQVDGEIYHAYCEALEKIELAVMAKTSIFKW